MRSLFRLLGAAVFASAALSVTSVASAAPINTMVSFGDSLSDPGNALFLTKDILGLNTGPAFLNAQGYVLDPNGRFSNGPTAVEYLASSLGFATTNRGWATPAPFATGPPLITPWAAHSPAPSRFPGFFHLAFRLGFSI